MATQSNHGCGSVWRATCGLAALTVLLALTACGSVQPAKPAASDGTHPEMPALLSSAQASDVTLYAIGLVGTPYRFGGNTPQSGFDCSGLIGHVYWVRAGLNPPRTVSKLKDWGRAVASDAVRSGDLAVFFQNNVATHAGIYVGEGRFVHAPSNGGRVKLDSLLSRYWSRQPVAFRRP